MAKLYRESGLLRMVPLLGKFTVPAVGIFAPLHPGSDPIKKFSALRSVPTQLQN